MAVLILRELKTLRKTIDKTAKIVLVERFEIYTQLLYMKTSLDCKFFLTSSLYVIIKKKLSVEKLFIVGSSECDYDFLNIINKKLGNLFEYIQIKI